MTSIVHGGDFNTTVLNPPNLNGFGAAANSHGIGKRLRPPQRPRLAGQPRPKKTSGTAHGEWRESDLPIQRADRRAALCGVHESRTTSKVSYPFKRLLTKDRS